MLWSDTASEPRGLEHDDGGRTDQPHDSRPIPQPDDRLDGRQDCRCFQDEGFAPNPDCAYEDGSVRRQTTQEYLESVDWVDPQHVSRALRVFGRLMHDFEPQYTEQLRHSLRRDGYVTDPGT